MEKDPRPSQVNNCNISKIVLSTWFRIHNSTHTEDTCPEFGYAINMFQQECYNWELSQPDESIPSKSHSENMMFEVYRATKDET